MDHGSDGPYIYMPLLCVKFILYVYIKRIHITSASTLVLEWESENVEYTARARLITVNNITIIKIDVFKNVNFLSNC